MTLLKILRFILLLHALCPDLALFPRKVRSCGYQKVIGPRSSRSSPPFLLLRDIHSKLLSDYRCIKGCAPSQSQVSVGASGGLRSQDGVSQQQEDAPLSIPPLNRLIEDSFVWDESSVSNSAVTDIPSHHKVTQQILSHW
jgi:hypothetical protein